MDKLFLAVVIFVFTSGVYGQGQEDQALDLEPISSQNFVLAPKSQIAQAKRFFEEQSKANSNWYFVRLKTDNTQGSELFKSSLVKEDFMQGRLQDPGNAEAHLQKLNDVAEQDQINKDELDKRIERLNRLRRTYKVFVTSPQQLNELTKSPWVEHVEPMFMIKVPWVGHGKSHATTASSGVTPNDPDFSQQWAPMTIGLPIAWANNNSTGSKNVRVGIIDTGVLATHEDLQSNLVDLPPGIQDTLGHGTHVCGIVGAVGNNQIGVAGVNWNLSMVPIPVFDSSEGASIDKICAGLEIAEQEQVTAVNMSLGGNFYSQTLSDCVGHAIDTGILVDAAGGNNGIDTRFESPANVPRVLAVGASDQTDQIAYFSNVGPQNWVYAPGQDILSTFNKSDSSYETLTGTSMATPMVTGLAALIKSVQSGLNEFQLKQIIKTSAKKITNTSTGEKFSRISAPDAMNAARSSRLPPSKRSVNKPVMGAIEGVQVAGYGSDMQVRIIGWAYDPDFPTAPAPVHMLINEVNQPSYFPYVIFFPDKARPDLARKGIPRGAKVGFDVLIPLGTLWDGLIPIPFLRFDFYVDDQIPTSAGPELAGFVPLTRAEDTTRNDWEWYINGYGDGSGNDAYGAVNSTGNNISGWVIDPDIAGAPVELHVVLPSGQTQKVAETTANLSNSSTQWLGWCYIDGAGNKQCPDSTSYGFNFNLSRIRGISPRSKFEVFVLDRNVYGTGGVLRALPLQGNPGNFSF